MSGRNSIVAMGESSKAAFEFPTSALIYPEPCAGTTQRDGMGREEGGGFGMGSTCIPVADSF